MNERIKLWDNLKYFLIILVVVGHFADKFYSDSVVCRNLFLFIYAFHMPLFLYISGLFHKNNKVASNAMFYIGVGFALKIVISLVKLLFYQKASFSLLSDSSLPWFMFVLAYYTVSAYLLRNQNKKYVLAFSIILALFCGFDKNIADFLYISRAVVFFPFYWLGTMTKPDDFQKLRKLKSLKAVSIAVLSAWILACVFMNDNIHSLLRTYFTGRHPFPEEYRAFGPLLRLFSYALSALTGFSLIMIMPSISLPLFTKYGKKTLNIYFWHSPIYIIIESLTEVKEACTTPFLHFVFVFSAILLSFLISAIPVFDYPIKLVKKFSYEKKE